ncbi:MAG: molecular chaperone DnaK [Kordiimonadales bacterium]|nr:MAG: molecular chaperone DnaK [Kordiimonadales bacterium]
MANDQTSEFWREKLITLRQELLELEKDAREHRGTVELDQQKVGRLSRMDAMQARAMEDAISARRKQALLRISGAFERLDENEFGYCLKCGEDIAVKRLEFDPTSLYCIGCSSN